MTPKISDEIKEEIPVIPKTNGGLEPDAPFADFRDQTNDAKTADYLPEDMDGRKQNTRDIDDANNSILKSMDIIKKNTAEISANEGDIMKIAERTGALYRNIAAHRASIIANRARLKIISND